MFWSAGEAQRVKLRGTTAHPRGVAAHARGKKLPPPGRGRFVEKGPRSSGETIPNSNLWNHMGNVTVSMGQRCH